MSLKPEYSCQNCKLVQPKATSTLKTCSRCKMAKYCNMECQKSHFPKHKNYCNIFKEFIEDFNQTPTLLRMVEYANLIGEYFSYVKQLHPDYFAYERIVEILGADHFASKEGWFAYPLLSESYYYLGHDEKLLEVLEKWEKDEVTDEGHLTEIKVLRIGLKLNGIAKARKDPPEKAVEFFEAFHEILLGSSQETHLKLAVSSPVMETVQKYINLSFVEELQDECASYMISAFENKENAFKAFSRIANENLTSDTCTHYTGILIHSQFYLQNHAEFQGIYQKYSKVYENNYI